MSACAPPICKTFAVACKTSEENFVKSSASVGNGVTVAQQTLTLFVLVRIQVPQPVPGTFLRCSTLGMPLGGMIDPFAVPSVATVCLI